jgi:hypothetical protein
MQAPSNTNSGTTQAAEIEIDLDQFCAWDRPAILQPFSYGEWTYAADGKIMIRVPRRADVAENNEAPNAAAAAIFEAMSRPRNAKTLRLQSVSSDPDFDRAVRQTPRGMFFWSGTSADPTAICGSCQSFQPEHQDSPRGRCGKHREHTGRRSDAFDRKTPACKYFEIAPHDVAQHAGATTGRYNDRRDKMDLSKYAGSSFINLEDVRDGPVAEKIVDIVPGEYDKPNLIFESGRRFSMNKTNTGTLIRLFGKESKAAIGQQIKLVAGKVPTQNGEQDSVLIKGMPPAGQRAAPQGAAQFFRRDRRHWPP